KNNVTLQEVFIKSPEKMFDEGALPCPTISGNVPVVNEFIFSVLGNDGLQRWFQKYRMDIDKRDCSNDQKLLDLARAFINYGPLRLTDNTTAPLGTEMAAVAVRSVSVFITIGSFAIARVRIHQKKDRDITSTQIVSMAEQLLCRADWEESQQETQASNSSSGKFL